VLSGADAPKPEGVIFPGLSASAMLHGLLSLARTRFNDAFRALVFPRDSAEFKRSYREWIVAFELLRQASPERSEIARFLVEKSHRWLLLRSGGVERPLADSLWELPQPPALEATALRGRAGWLPAVPFDGKTFSGHDLGALGEQLVARQLATPQVAEALAWVAANALGRGGRIELAGRRFAVLGAAAEIAPTRLLLAAGADVLWLDLTSPPEAWWMDDALSGRIVRGAGLGDLLAHPREVAAAISEFGAATPVDCGLFAYAGGSGREWRLASAMNAIVDAVGPERVRSVSLYISPTHPAALSPAELALTERRVSAAPAWQRTLVKLGALGRPGVASKGEARVQRAIVELQGASYQAAQYLEKVLAIERWAAFGIAGEGGAAAVSANVAGITRTRSLSHPLFAAAYLGGRAFGVETFSPETTRPLSALLMLHDLLNPKAAGAPGPARERAPQAVFAQRVHGGVYGLPYELERTMVAAALIGFARQPALLGGFFKRRTASA
jgi:hypothetical protein